MKKYIAFILIIIIAIGGYIFLPKIKKITYKNNQNSNSQNSIPHSQIKTVKEQEELIPNLTFEEFMQKGEEFFSNDFLTFAANNFAAAAKLKPNDKKANTRLIETYIAQKDFDAAEKTCKNTLKTFNNDADFLLLLGMILIQTSKFDEAKEIFTALPEKMMEKYFYLGALAAFNQDDETAKNYLEKAKSATKIKNKSDVLLGAYKEFSLFPEGNVLHLRLLIAKGFNQLELYEMAIAASKSILKENQKYRDAWLILGHSYLALEKFEFARNAFISAMNLDSTKPETAYFLGIAEAELNNYDGAIKLIENAIINGFNPQVDAIKKLGDIYILQNNYTQAAKKYEEVLRISDASVDNFVKPIWILIENLNDYANALKLAKWAVSKHPQSPVAHNLLGWALIASENYEEAKKSLNQAIAIDPNFSAAYLNFGKLYKATGETETSLKYYKKSYELDPHSSVGAMAAQEYNNLISDNQ